jgi:hypothetical protein
VIRVQKLRKKAERLRRVASIPTNGTGLANRHLVGLDKEADNREAYLKGQSEADKPAS